jgi:hypothetical protein
MKIIKQTFSCNYYYQIKAMATKPSQEYSILDETVLPVQG